MNRTLKKYSNLVLLLVFFSFSLLLSGCGDVDENSAEHYGPVCGNDGICIRMTITPSAIHSGGSVTVIITTTDEYGTPLGNVLIFLSGFVDAEDEEDEENLPRTGFSGKFVGSLEVEGGAYTIETITASTLNASVDGQVYILPSAIGD
ncbi:MAG: hypothetical protein ACN4E2_02375 [Nitrospinota bacterium]